MRNRHHQRGYNLVEIAIVMVVSLMMASWLAVNYFEAQKNERRQETMATIEVIKEAIVDYAAKHSARSYLINNSDTTIDYLWRTPAGRPYLPCPDITGDGYEDRRPINSAVSLSIDAVRSALEEGGDCYKNKGVVPWRTLDVPPTDWWGNRFTYRVGNNFSNAMLGFDEYTRADHGLYTRPLTVVASIPLRYANGPIPIRIRSTAGNSVVMSIWGGTIHNEDEPSVICSVGPCSPATTRSEDIVAGEVATVDITLRTGGYKVSSGVFTAFEADSIINGLPIVIVSHGENGFGAVRGDETEGAPTCIGIPSNGHEEERQNAYRFTQTTTGCPQVTLAGGRESGFVAHPRADPVTEEFDDIVGWMATDELVSALRKRGALPVELLPPIGLEE